MTNEQNSEATPGTIDHSAAERRPRRATKPTILASVAGLALLAVGAGAGAAGYSMMHRGPATFDTAMATTPITDLSDSNRTEIQGKVAEIFGNKFVVEDGTGRALVETGRAGEGGKLVAANETVTVQGRFENGFLHASSLQRADGSIDELNPPPPPPPRGPRP